MKSRIASTLVLWTLTIVSIVYLKSFGLALIVALLSAAAIYETCAIAKVAGLKPMHVLIQFFNALIFISAWGLSFFGISGFGAGAVAFALAVALLSLSIIKNTTSEFAAKTFVPTVLILLSIPFMLQWYAVLGVKCVTKECEYTGIIFALWIIAAAKFSDVGAYVIGKAFGKIKLAPSISPNKTVEGAIGGVFSSSALSSIIAWLCAPMLPPSFNIWTAAVAGAIIAVTAIVSDLVESVFKRRARVKDSGAIIPGIGGALDLADSLLLSAPVGVALLMVILSI